MPTGKGVGCIIDGVPPRLALTEDDIQPQLTRRRPGQSRLTTPRAEKDLVSIISGTEFGHTLGTPVGLLVKNEDQRPGDYSEMSKIPRPGHADYTYQIKCLNSLTHSLATLPPAGPLATLIEIQCGRSARGMRPSAPSIPDR